MRAADACTCFPKDERKVRRAEGTVCRIVDISSGKLSVVHGVRSDAYGRGENQRNCREKNAYRIHSKVQEDKTAQSVAIQTLMVNVQA